MHMIPGLYSLFLKRMCEIKTKKKIIPFPMIFEKICRSFSMTKEECWEILFLFRDTGFIDIHEGHGIKILKRKMTRENGIRLLAHEVPKSCINQCDKCHKDFEADIRVQDTCDNCSKEIDKRVDEKVKDAIAKGSTNPHWVLKIHELIKESGKKNRDYLKGV